MNGLYVIDLHLALVVYPLAMLLGLATGVGIVQRLTGGATWSRRRTWAAILAIAALLAYPLASRPDYATWTLTFWALSAWGMALVDLAIVWVLDPLRHPRLFTRRAARWVGLGLVPGSAAWLGVIRARFDLNYSADRPWEPVRQVLWVVIPVVLIDVALRLAALLWTRRRRGRGAAATSTPP